MLTDEQSYGKFGYHNLDALNVPADDGLNTLFTR